MGKESFLLVSLKEEKAKKLAQVLSNESCRKILEYLAENESTESELAKLLNLPLSTVHYNLRHLVDAGLVTAEEFHYSKKGKEVNHYKLSNKYVIIAPKSTFGLKERLKNILPVALIMTAIGGIIHLFSKTNIFFNVLKESSILSVAEQTKSLAAVQAADQLSKIATESALPATTPVINETLKIVTNTITIQPLIPISLWFLIGALSALLIYLLWNTLVSKRNK